MSNEKVFIEGMYIKEVKTQYGEILKISIDMQKFYSFAKNHAVKSETNDKTSLRIEILTSKSGKKYASLDTWAPSEAKVKEKEVKEESFDEDVIPF